MAAKKKTSSQNKKTTEIPVKTEHVEWDKKYRPKTLDEFYGNEQVVKAIKTSIESGKTPKTFFLYGERGCGKTTLARIIASHFCHNHAIRELNTANFSGIDTSREIANNMMTAPFKGKYKAYIIDECAMLGQGGDSSKNAAQHALLKPLEEPPKHVFFFLCTTDPQNVIKPLKDRCTQYELSPLSDKRVYSLLMNVAEKEDIELPKEAAKQICKTAEGRPRSAVKLFEQISTLDPNEMEEAASKLIEEREQAINLCRKMAKINSKTEWKEIADILKNLNEDPEQVRRMIRGYFSKILLNGDEWASIILDTFSSPYYNIDSRNELIKDVYEVYTELSE